MTDIAELEVFLYDSCKKDSDILMALVKDHISMLDDEGLKMLEDFLVNYCGDD